MSAQIIETEETLIIETPERVPLAFALASIGNRFIAVAIDHAIQFLSMAVIALVLLFAAGAFDAAGSSIVDNIGIDTPNWIMALLILVVFLLFTGYFAFFEWWWDGQTPGKRLMKLRVIREDGRPITLWEAIARNILRIFDSFPPPLFYSIGLIVVFLNSRDQRVGDMFAGTVVIRERTDEAPTFAETFSNPVADGAFRRVQPRTAFDANISSIGEREIEIVESFLRRRWDLTERQRIWMAWRIALPIMFRLRPTYDAQTFTYEGFLEELLHKYHAKQRFIN